MLTNIQCYDPMPYETSPTLEVWDSSVGSKREIPPTGSEKVVSKNSLGN